jgi:hypothetical protein
VPGRLQRVEDSVAAAAVQRRASGAARDVSLNAASLPAVAPRSSAMRPAATSSGEDVFAPGGPAGGTPMRGSVTQSLLPAIEHSPPIRQAALDWAGDRIVPSRQHANEHRDPFRQRTAERPPNLPARRAPDMRAGRAEESARAQRPAAATNEIHLDIGNIQIALPRARPRPARSEPPPLKGKPRIGPDG